ncbi:MAG TPA: PAS domain-containing protein, partial [Verrucomicrobiota bacterium]|nr:PAS domain-containing protein [Verrucomicrobiota bacterium]
MHSGIGEGPLGLRTESGPEQASAARIAKLEAMVRERDELLRLLSVHAPVGFFQTDGAGRLIRTNARWREIARLSHIAEPRGVWWQMVDPGDRERVVVAWEAAVRHGCEFRDEFRTNTGAGWTCYVRTRIVPVIEEGGAVGKYIGVSEDITERRRLESALRRAREDL